LLREEPAGSSWEEQVLLRTLVVLKALIAFLVLIRRMQ
jgi:hypothetical protein